MVLRIVVGVIVAAVVVFGIAVVLVMGSLRRLSEVTRTVQVRQQQAEIELAPGLQALHETAARLEQPVADAQSRAEGIKARFGR